MLTLTSNDSCGVVILWETEVGNLGEGFSTSNQLVDLDICLELLGVDGSSIASSIADDR